LTQNEKLYLTDLFMYLFINYKYRTVTDWL